MAEPTNATTATAGAPETGTDAGSREEQGSSSKDRSLTSPEEGQTSGLTLMERAMKAQDAMEAKNKAILDPPTEQADQPAQEEAQVTEQEAEAQPAQEEKPAETEDDQDDSQADEDGVLRDDKGRAYVRPARLKKILANSKKAELLEQEVAFLRRQVDLGQGKQQPEAKQAPKPDEALESKIAEIKAAMKKAKTDFDSDAEIAAQEQLIDLLSQKKAQALINDARSEDAKVNQARGWEAKLDEAERSNAEERQRMWKEDQARVAALRNEKLDLRDQESPFYKAVLGQLQDWYSQKHPILTTKGAFRKAVEITAEAHGFELPPISVKVEAKAPPPVKSETVQRKNASVTGGGQAKASNAPVATQDAVAKLRNLPPKERFGILAALQESQKKGR